MCLHRLVFLLALVLTVVQSTAIGQNVAPVQVGPPCPEPVCYHDVICHRCVQVPDKREIKKTVYEVHEVPFCLPKLPPLHSLLHHNCCCDQCVECQCPRYKKVLVKKEIVCGEICGTKCVIEEFVERVPCKACAPCPQCDGGLPPLPALTRLPPVPPAP